jgi:hypothetical protein
MQIIPHESYAHGYIVGVGPSAPSGSRYWACGRGGFVAQCQGCGKPLCPSHWWRHSHTSTHMPGYEPLSVGPSTSSGRAVPGGGA